MALTAVEDVYNLALGLIGEYEITEGLTTEKQYKLCARFYAKARDKVLTKHLWNEAVTDTVILQETVGPVMLHAYRYAVPSDSLRVMSIGSDLYHWERKGGYIVTDYTKIPEVWVTSEDYVAGQYVQVDAVTYLCDTSHTSSVWADESANWTTQGGDYGVIEVEYIKQLTDTTEWSINLEDAIAQELAIKVAMAISGDPKIKEALLLEFNEDILPQARSIDAVEGRLKPLYQSKWLRARR